MTAMRVYVGFVVIVALAMLAGGQAVAQECTGGCGLQRKACLLGARADKLACKLGCRVNATPEDRGACLRGCADTYRARRESCGTEQDGCRGLCLPTPAPSVDRTCLERCGGDLADCARPIVADAKTCLIGCKGAADRLACLQGCVVAAEGDAIACGAAFTTCAAGCGVPPPPPPPPPPPAEECIEGCGVGLTQCLGDVASAAFACATGCASDPNPLACLQGCRATAEQDAAGCRTVFDGCVAGCAP